MNTLTPVNLFNLNTTPSSTPRLKLLGTDILSFMHKDAVAQMVELIANHLYGYQGLQVLAYMEILSSPTNIEFRYNNQLFAVYCSNDLSVAYAKCQCGVKNLLHDHTYVRSSHWELYFRGHLLEWQFSPSNPKVQEESTHAIQ